MQDIPYTINGKRVEVPVKKVSTAEYGQPVPPVFPVVCRGCSMFSCAALTSFSDQIINGAPISSVNPATLRNPECLAEYEAIGRKLRAEIE